MQPLRRFWRDNSVLGASTAAAGVANWLYAVVLAHRLGPVAFGDVSVLNNMVVVLMLPASVVTLVATRTGRTGVRWRRAAGWRWLAGGMLWLIPALLNRRLGSALHVPSGLLWVWPLAAFPIMDYAANVGYLQRARQYGRVGGLAVGGSLAAVGAAGVAAVVPHRLLVLGTLQALLAGGLWAFSACWATRLTPQPNLPEGRAVLLPAIAGTLGSLLTLTDSIVAKARFSPLTAGHYTGLATIGQAVPFVAGALATVLLTAVLDHPGDSRRWLARTLMLYGALAGGADILFLAAPDAVVRVALGSAFLPISGLLPLYGAGMTGLGTVLILLAFAVARHRWAGVWPVMLGWTGWVLWLAREPTLPGLVTATAVTMLTTLAMQGVALGLVAGSETGRTQRRYG
ncbi:MAG: capsular biosynthesis protein [Thermaerobacter sp.]|nr:capsular biosynthesis protein [Thermaerobacter sp.]